MATKYKVVSLSKNAKIHKFKPLKCEYLVVFLDFLGVNLLYLSIELLIGSKQTFWLYKMNIFKLLNNY